MRGEPFVDFNQSFPLALNENDVRTFCQVSSVPLYERIFAAYLVWTGFQARQNICFSNFHSMRLFKPFSVYKIFDKKASVQLKLFCDMNFLQEEFNNVVSSYYFQVHALKLFNFRNFSHS